VKNISFYYLLSKKKYLPKKYHLSDYAWRNSEITEIFNYIIDNNVFHKPVVFTFWYDCRRDSQISTHVKRAIQKIKEKGLYDDSIIIMHSDHGYPDPKTKLNEGFFKNLGHDMVLTDDNIKTPLIVKYPDCPKGISIPNIVGHVDILPTIFDILELNHEKIKTQFQGKSLLPIIQGNEKDHRIRRSDTRLEMDIGKIMSLRSKDYKYLYFYDDGTEYLIDIKQDKEEVHNIIYKNNIKEKVHEFRILKDTYDDEIFAFHKNNLLENALTHLNLNGNKTKKILVVSKAPQRLLEILFSFLSNNHKCQIDLVYSSDKQEKDKIGFDNCYSATELNKSNLKHYRAQGYSTLIYLTENSKRVFLKKEIYDGLQSINAKSNIMLNYNFESFNYLFHRWFGIDIIKLFFDWEIKGFFYRQEPIYFLRDLTFLVTSIIKKKILKKNLNEDVNAAKEIMEFRKFHFKLNESGFDEMSETQFDYEFDRIKTKED